IVPEKYDSLDRRTAARTESVEGGRQVKLHRPYIPLSVRIEVATRQMYLAKMAILARKHLSLRGKRRQLRAMLYALFGDNKVHLDHDPQLMARQRFLESDGQLYGYIPTANDPDYLVYRTAEDHKTKTFVRGDGAQRSDMGQRRYLKRVARR